MSEEQFNKLYVKDKKPGQQIQKFNRLIVEGILKNGREVECYSAATVSKPLLDQTILRLENDSIYHYSLIINIPGIKNLYNFVSSFFLTLFRRKGDYLIDPLSFDNALGTILANRVRGNTSISIVTDLPEFMSISGLYINAVNKIMALSDGYVFLTEALNEHVNQKNRPWLLMEGLMDASIEMTETGHREKTIIYAGTMNERNGVKNLINAFLAEDLKEYELHFYGNGSFEEELKKICNEHKNIYYHGSVPNNQLMGTMKSASLLINPRPVEQDFTKYSFPSKTMEYLSTGTYSSCTELPGIPKEYFNYIGSLGKGTVEEICSFFRSFTNMTAEERNKKARAGREFVMKEKNNIRQAKRILDLIDEVNGVKA